MGHLHVGDLIAIGEHTVTWVVSCRCRGCGVRRVEKKSGMGGMGCSGVLEETRNEFHA
ncbi:hypothetical protein M422DRAFT_39375, partial [Sphaerobolus stellatus SS14]